MKHLQEVFKRVETELRGNNNLSVETNGILADLNEWDFEIVKHFITEVRLTIQRNDLNFVFKKYDYTEPIANKSSQLDLLICTPKRNKEDLILTDITNRLVIPKELKYDTMTVWGMPVEQARNFCIENALSRGAKYLFFIDDDMILENTTLVKLWETIQLTNSVCVAANYQRKAEYEVSAHGNLELIDINLIEQTSKNNPYENLIDNIYETDLCAMGCTLIDLNKLTKNVPAPYFWVFLAPDGLWSMGEDAFFTRNLISYIGEKPIIDTRPSVLHYDKRWKKTFGKRNKDVTYATNKIDDFVTFDHIRIPPEYPTIAVCIPKRSEQEIEATNYDWIPFPRGYKPRFLKVWGFNVDHARNELATQSVRVDSKYLLFIDNDIVLHRDCVSKMIDVMERDSDEEIGMIVGDYMLKGTPHHSVHLQVPSNGPLKGIVSELHKLNSDEVELYDENESLWLANWLCGMGCCLIRTSVFRQIQFPWFRCYNQKPHEVEGGGVNEDAQFSEMLFNNGYKVIHHREVYCLHVDFNNRRVYGFEKELDLRNYCGYPWLEQMQYISME